MKLLQSPSPIILAFIMASSLLFGVGCNGEKGEAPSSNTQARESAPPKAISQTNTPARPINRLEWNLQTTVAPYEKSANTNPAWNAPALAALKAFASLRSGIAVTNGSWREVIATNCDFAVKAGCRDPLIGYLHARTVVDREMDEESLAEKLIGAVTKLQSSAYPTIHKFYAAVDAIEASSEAFTSVVHQQKVKGITVPNDYLSGILNDPKIPVEEAYEVCERMLRASADIEELKRYETIYRALEQPMLRRWPKDYRTWLIKGTAYIRMGWIHRGGGVADTVTVEGLKGFNDSIAEAQKALEKGWSFNQNNTEIPLKMMTVALAGCGGKTRDLMELWFARAMKVDSNCVAACRSKLYFLEPKWHGSDYFQLAFGRECVESTQWGGRVPLTLLDVHEGIAERSEDAMRTNYWKQPGVWLDLQEAFDTYIERNPGDTNMYYSYLRYAIRCQRWDKVKELLPKFGPASYQIFGGKERYDKLVERADSLAPKTTPPKLTLPIDGQRAIARLINRLDFWATTEEMDDAFKTYEKILDKYPIATAAERARILMNEAAICIQAPHLHERAKQLYTRIKTEFPETRAAKEADRQLAELAGTPSIPVPGQQ